MFFFSRILSLKVFFLVLLWQRICFSHLCWGVITWKHLQESQVWWGGLRWNGQPSASLKGTLERKAHSFSSRQFFHFPYEFTFFSSPFFSPFPTLRGTDLFPCPPSVALSILSHHVKVFFLFISVSPFPYLRPFSLLFTCRPFHIVADGYYLVQQRNFSWWW